eukprot:CAMPEP_0194153002 /NCGR_PEP_ID=MMETSP0152-20130528/54916_1 /TAXON_ID=1049557 /ORGANISM="Thalassiothrix antarctica, Strain L6-D1" /LENGTH=264 /DNA_ID=CAMNT_0038858007 /DNA_START=37 /DNA_END=831 /DNA_ORIENTATION=+
MKRSKTVSDARNLLSSSTRRPNSSTLSLPTTRKRSKGLSRRCTSELSLRRIGSMGGSRSGSIKNYSRKATILMAQRSNATGVRKIVQSLDEKCDKASAKPNEIPPADDPYPYCALIMHIADDAYYRVVLGSANCISILIKAMSLFPQHVTLQETCCCALGKLCEGNGSNQRAVVNANGVEQIVNSMKQHSGNIAVQSAACDTLKQMKTMLINEDTFQMNEKLVQEVMLCLNTAKQMYITAKSKVHAEELFLALETRYKPSEQSS